MVAGLMSCYQVTDADRTQNAMKREKGYVVGSEGVETAYDIKSGKDCFALSYHDDFNYNSVDELLEAVHDGSKEPVWTARNDRNIHRDGISLEEGRLGLWVKRVDDPNHPVVKENRRIAKTLCGGITYNREVKYGYIEARLRMYKKKSSQYWPGFYTYVLKKDDNGKSPSDKKRRRSGLRKPFISDCCRFAAKDYICCCGR